MELDFDIPDPAVGPFLSEKDTHASAVLFLHGITGSPAAWTPIARAIAALGHSVSVPLLPGHGTRWQDLNSSGWDDWTEAATAEYRRLAATHDHVLVAGLSMGGALALHLGIATAEAERPPEALLLVNPALYVDSPLAPALPLLRHIVPSVAAIGNDIASPGRDEHAYDRTPIAAIASFHAALPCLRADLVHLETPVTVLVSGRDAVVGPRSLRRLRADLARAPEIITLRHSRHVATLDYDAVLIAETILTRLRAGQRGPEGNRGE